MSKLRINPILSQLGWLDKTVGSRDFGADLVFNDRSGTRNVIQAKRYFENNPIGISAIQEVYSSMRFYKAKKSIVIGTSSFTTSCETLAGINHVKLLDRQDLIEIIALFKQGNLNLEIDEGAPGYKIRHNELSL